MKPRSQQSEGAARSCVRLSLWLGLVITPQLAQADVADDVRRIATGWTDARADRVDVEEHALFLFPQSVQTLELSKPGCGRLVLIGPMGLSFDAQISGAEPEIRSSFAGVLDAGAFCVGSTKTMIRVAAPAGRGTVEVVFGRGATSAIDLYGMLGRPRPAGPNLGAPPLPPSAAAGGHERFAAQRTREGATRVLRRVQAGDEPVFRVPLEAGCHVAEVAAEGLRARMRYDLDAEARVVAAEPDEEERVVALDRSSAAEAALDFCLAAPAEVEVRVRGAAVALETRLSIATFPFRLEVPSELGASAKNAVERAFRVRGGSMASPRLREAELFAVGVVRRRVMQRAGSCLVAFATALDGAARGVVLTVAGHRDEIRQGDVAATVAFCTGSERAFDVEVESRGALPGAAFLLYEVGP